MLVFACSNQRRRVSRTLALMVTLDFFCFYFTGIIDIRERAVRLLRGRPDPLRTTPAVCGNRAVGGGGGVGKRVVRDRSVCNTR
jgi:hypothetical protein